MALKSDIAWAIDMYYTKQRDDAMIAAGVLGDLFGDQEKK